MASRHQIEYLITEATERVAEQGVSADTPDLMLAAFGYLAHEVRRPKHTWDGKKLMAGGTAAGVAVVVGLIEAVKALLG